MLLGMIGTAITLYFLGMFIFGRKLCCFCGDYAVHDLLCLMFWPIAYPYYSLTIKKIYNFFSFFYDLSLISVGIVSPIIVLGWIFDSIHRYLPWRNTSIVPFIGIAEFVLLLIFFGTCLFGFSKIVKLKQYFSK